ncbi:MAG: CDP-alcohol phosphatidyltransferase family protein [Candidatus Poribacteria bacterium]|nr:CDP-alcohol phosphatidyltransferase family protein [Candidatus Poribacteria bacterium]
MALKAPIHQFTETQSIQIASRDFFYISNILSVSRLITVPFIFYFIYREQWIYAIVCGAIAVITDLLDGFCARRLEQHTELGYILDPVADKLALFAAVSALALLKSTFPVWAFLVIVIRDVSILIGNGILAYKAKMITRSNLWGKCTSFFLSIAIMLYLLRPITSLLPGNIEFYGLCLALVFVVISTVSYARHMFSVLKTHSQQ